jgi:hypothetical protein
MAMMIYVGGRFVDAEQVTAQRAKKLLKKPTEVQETTDTLEVSIEETVVQETTDQLSLDETRKIYVDISGKEPTPTRRNDYEWLTSQIEALSLSAS